MNLVKIAPRPEEMIVKIKEGKRSFTETFDFLGTGLIQTKNAVSALMEWQEGFLEEYLPLIKTDQSFRKNMEAYKKYGQVSSVQEAIEKLPVARSQKTEITSIIEEKVKRWVSENNNMILLGKRMRAILVKEIIKKFQLEAVDRVPCCIVPEMIEWIKSFRFPHMLSFGPLAVLLAHSRVLRGVSEAKAAILCGAKTSTYACWERGESVPKKDYWPALADFVGKTLEEIENAAEMQRRHRCSSRSTTPY